MSIGNWYRVGTVAVTNGSVNVVGTGTFWTSQCNPGDRFTVDGENWYEVNTITDDTHLTLLSVGGSGAFAGTTASNIAYAIDRNFTNNLNANIAASVAALVAQYQSNSNGPLSGLFGNGAAATPGIAFLNEASTGLFHPATGMAALAVQGAEFLRAVGTAAGVPAMLGLGLTAPANALDVFTTNNALYGARIQNASAGTAARAALQIGNTSAAAQVLNLGVNGASFTANGVLAPSRGFVEGPNGVDFASAVTSGNAFTWGVGAGYTQKMVMDSLGDVAIGGSPVTVSGYTTLTLNNATTGGILDIQAAGVDVGRLTGSAAALNLAAIGSSVPFTVTVNGSERSRTDTGGVFNVGNFAADRGFNGYSKLAPSSLSLYVGTGTTNIVAGGKVVAVSNNGSPDLYSGLSLQSITTAGVAYGSEAYAESIRATYSEVLLATSGATRVTIDASGRLGLGVMPSGWTSGTSFDIGARTGLYDFPGGPGFLLTSNAYLNGAWIAKTTGASALYQQIYGAHYWATAPSVAAGTTASMGVNMTLDASGNLLVGVGSGSNHTLIKTALTGAAVLQIAGGSANNSGIFLAVDNQSWNSVNCALLMGKNATTGRTINAAGTLNASGADYAEYRELIPSLHGHVAKGALLGYDASGLMTNVFADVIGRVLPKSTNPSYVGGDTWGTADAIVERHGVAAPGNRPPVVLEPSAPALVDDPGDDATAEAAAAYAAYIAASAAYPAQLTAYEGYVSEEAAYQARLAIFNAALETERAKYDRIALCGVVPVNIAGLTAADVGKYLVPCGAADGTITAVAVAKADLTLGQYIDSFGTIEKIGADGRPLVNVKNA